MQDSTARQLDTKTLSWERTVTQPQQRLLVKPIQHPAGEGTACFENDHTIWMSLAPRPVQLLHAQDGKTHLDFYGKGDMVITPANMPLFARWESDDHILQIRLNTQFLDQIAQETLRKGDRLTLQPKFKVRDPQIEAIALMLLTEHQQNDSNGPLYLDSLANVLAVNVLQHHATTPQALPTYDGGLPQHQLAQVLDYIDAHLDQDLKLANIAQLTEMSQFHFSRLFKQSTGLSPHQYLLQQRIEQAKRLLKQTNQSILDIALSCGFSSHSHLSRKFRELTEMTPKAYRTQ
ncbi:MAG: AraC family transcriptional regulator [Leptolyngbyaceae bacterium]|nr:AraC family transcriptional regulator [Leptolyngbyaceae bacterium]